MRKNNPVSQELIVVHDFKALATAYQEISVMKMQEVKGKVIQSRSFLEGLSGVFNEVKAAYHKQIEELVRKNQKKFSTKLTTSAMQKNGKEVLIWLSANTKLYGEIINKTFRLFLQEADKNPAADIVVVGHLGKEMYDQAENKRAYKYYEIPDIKVKIEDLQKLITDLLPYERVKVFYGKFENVINQLPEMQMVSGEQDLAQAKQEAQKTLKEKQKQNEQPYTFFFEPSLETILNFFETQIFSSLLNQTVHENELARYASRIKAMEESLGNINGTIKRLRAAERRLANLEANRKQLAALSGISLWTK
jgi:ATP synthase F1 gamma subunit